MKFLFFSCKLTELRNPMINSLIFLKLSKSFTLIQNKNKRSLSSIYVIGYLDQLCLLNVVIINYLTKLNDLGSAVVDTNSSGRNSVMLNFTSVMRMRWNLPCVCGGNVTYISSVIDIFREYYVKN